MWVCVCEWLITTDENKCFVVLRALNYGQHAEMIHSSFLFLTFFFCNICSSACEHVCLLLPASVVMTADGVSAATCVHRLGPHTHNKQRSNVLITQFLHMVPCSLTCAGFILQRSSVMDIDDDDGDPSIHYLCSKVLRGAENTYSLGPNTHYLKLDYDFFIYKQKQMLSRISTPSMLLFLEGNF